MKALRRILLVEDNPKDLDLTLAALEEHALANAVDVARDGVEALDYLYRRDKYADRNKEYPVVILLDIKMPRLNGLEVLRQMKSDPFAETPACRHAHFIPGGTGPRGLL